MSTHTEPPFETKGAQNATINIDQAEGVVEAFAAAIGNKDSVGDIITPGAFSASLQRRKPRVVWGHDWNSPIGKVLEIVEVLPGDKRLPGKMKNANVGGLYVKVKFNLASERGRQAFADVMFYGEEQEWSIGYKTIRKTYDPSRQANILQEVELYEVSPVLHGANNLTSTISVKTDDTGNPVNVTSSANTSTAMTNNISYYGISDFNHLTNTDEKGAFYNETVSNITSPMPVITEEQAQMMRLQKTVTTAFGPMTELQFIDKDKCVFRKPDGYLYGIRYKIDGPRLVVSKPKKVQIRTVVEPLTEPSSSEGFSPDRVERKRDYSSEQREDMAKKGQAMADGSYPIADVEDLKNAIQSVGRAKNIDDTRRHIVKRARALGETQLLPESWNISGKSEEFMTLQQVKEILSEGRESSVKVDEKTLENLSSLLTWWESEEKAGRVISAANLSKLTRAAEMIQEVMVAGSRPEPGIVEKKDSETLLDSYKTANNDDRIVVAATDSITGKYVTVKSVSEPSMEKLIGLVSDLEVLAAKHGWAVIAPSQKSLDAGTCTLEVYFSTDDELEEQGKNLAKALKSANCDASVSVQELDFYRMGNKAFREVLSEI